jgi:phage anti-repressor protein
MENSIRNRVTNHPTPRGGLNKLKGECKMENELIVLNYGEERITTSAYRLWEGLDKPYTEFSKWFKHYCTNFTEGIDYSQLVDRIFIRSTCRQREYEITDYQITLDMAKNLAMMQNSQKGKEFREYFIEVEKQWNDPDKVIQRAQQILITRCAKLEQERDEAIRTKAQINDTQTATALGKVGGLTKENNRLKKEVGILNGYATITVMEKRHGGKYNWRLLVACCTKHNLKIEKVPCPRYDEVNTYPLAAWKIVYGIE